MCGVCFRFGLVGREWRSVADEFPGGATDEEARTLVPPFALGSSLDFPDVYMKISY